ASRMMDEEIPGAIEDVYSRYGYVVDPHTACGFQEIDPEKTSVVLATASPAKFPETIERAIGIEPKHERLEKLKDREIVKHKIAADPAAIKAFIEENS